MLKNRVKQPEKPNFRKKEIKKSILLNGYWFGKILNNFIKRIKSIENAKSMRFCSAYKFCAFLLC